MDETCNMTDSKAKFFSSHEPVKPDKFCDSKIQWFPFQKEEMGKEKVMDPK